MNVMPGYRVTASNLHNSNQTSNLSLSLSPPMVSNPATTNKEPWFTSHLAIYVLPERNQHQRQQTNFIKTPPWKSTIYICMCV